jgi:hypothetical protein
MAIFWVSFADLEKPVGSQFAGVLILEADDLEAAMAKAHAASDNPAYKMTFEDISLRNPPRDWLSRRLDAKEARDLNRLMCKMAQQDDED